MRGAILAPLPRFHLRLGVRFALRSMVPLVAPPIAVIGLAPDPAETLVLITRRLLTEAADPAWLLATGLLYLAMASQATRQITRDLTGWVHALPANGAGRRRGVILGCFAAQAPVMMVIGILAVGAAVSAQNLSAPVLIGLFIVPVCAAYAVVPLRRRAATATMGLAACWLCVRGGWTELAMAGILLFAAESTAGPLRRARPARGFRRMPAPVFRLVVNWRASGWRATVAYLIAALPIVIAALALANNTLGDSSAGMIVRLATGVAVTMTLASLARTIAIHRPPWPWSRSLPRSSAGRVFDDTLFLAVSSVPVILAAGWLAPVPALTASLPVVWLAARAAGHLRLVARHPLLDAGSRTALDGTIMSGLVALLPWTSVPVAVLALHALHVSARHDRRLKISRLPDDRMTAARSEVPS